MSSLRKAFLSSLAVCLLLSGCMSSNTTKNPLISPTITQETAYPGTCEELRQKLLLMAPVGTSAATAISLLESEGFTCALTGADGQTIYATRTDQRSYWSSQRWMVVGTMNQGKVVEFTVTQGK